MSRRVLRFYELDKPEKGLSYNFADIVYSWSDLQLQKNQGYINWLFPSETDEETKLSKGLAYKFWTNQNLRKKVVQATLRMMNFFGFSVTVVTDDGTPSVVTGSRLVLNTTKSLIRAEDGVNLGLGNPENLAKITRILHFLERCSFPYLSSLFFLMLCRAMRESPEFKHLVKKNNIIQQWIDCLPYLRKDKWKIEENLFGEELAEWEKRSTLDLVSNTRRVANDAWRD